jgi:hypothetical protein
MLNDPARVERGWVDTRASAVTQKQICWRELAYLIAITKAFNLDQLNDLSVNHSAGWQHRRDRAAPAADHISDREA